jgi:hypothetical protein
MLTYYVTNLNMFTITKTESIKYIIVPVLNVMSKGTYYFI